MKITRRSIVYKKLKTFKKYIIRHLGDIFCCFFLVWQYCYDTISMSFHVFFLRKLWFYRVLGNHIYFWTRCQLLPKANLSTCKSTNFLMTSQCSTHNHIVPPFVWTIAYSVSPSWRVHHSSNWGSNRGVYCCLNHWAASWLFVVGESSLRKWSDRVAHLIGCGGSRF